MGNKEKPACYWFGQWPEAQSLVGDECKCLMSTVSKLGSIFEAAGKGVNEKGKERGKYVKYKFDSVLENRPLTMINIKNRGQRWSQLSGWKRRELEYSIWNPDGKRKP